MLAAHLTRWSRLADADSFLVDTSPEARSRMKSAVLMPKGMEKPSRWNQSAARLARPAQQTNAVLNVKRSLRI